MVRVGYTTIRGRIKRMEIVTSGEKKKKAVRKVIEVYKAMNSLGKVSPSYLLICISELEQGKIDISKGSLVSV